MANVRVVDRGQQWLMPPSLSEWLPEGHLAWFIIDVVAELDLAEFYRSLRADGRGGASYDPEAMLGILLYAYCVGERSSRRIERRLCDDVAFRVVAANHQPDHATLARFRRRYQDAIAGVFGQVLGLADACARAWRLTGEPHWMEAVMRAAEWLIGANDRGAVLYDAATGGCYDGLTLSGVNLNKGAESTLAGLGTLQQADRVLRE